MQPVDGFSSILGGISSATACVTDRCTLFYWMEGAQDMIELQCDTRYACGLETFYGNDNGEKNEFFLILCVNVNIKLLVTLRYGECPRKSWSHNYFGKA